MTEEHKPGALQTQVATDLEYCFRDIFTVYAGPEEVVLEFGNLHRSVPNQARIANRIVLPVSKAVALRDALHQTITEMAKRQKEAQAASHPAEADNSKQ